MAPLPQLPWCWNVDDHMGHLTTQRCRPRSFRRLSCYIFGQDQQGLHTEHVSHRNRIYIYALIYPWILDSLVISNVDMSNRIKKLKRNILQHVLFPPNPVVAPHLQSSRSSSPSPSSSSPSPSSSPPSPSSSSHHHITLKFATPPEQYVGRGNNINFIFMRDLTSPPSLNNMLVGVIASTLSSWGIKICHSLCTICWLR